MSPLRLILHFLAIALLVAVSLPGALAQEKFSKMFKSSLKSLQNKMSFLGNVSNVTSILDVGANNADWSDLMKSYYFPQAEYFLIEGNEHYKKMITSKGYLFEIALVGDKENEKVQFHYNPRYPTGGSFMTKKGGKRVRGDNMVEQYITTIDSIMSKRGVKPPQIMKMDIQGAEFRALHGAKQTLKSVEILIAEVALHQYNPGAASFTDMNVYLESQGFKFYDIADFRSETWVYGDVPGRKPVRTTVQMDVIWVKESSAFFTATGFAKAPPGKYKCDYVDSL
jgi:FkbM family methyltransferase